MLITHHIDFKEQLTDFDCFIVATALECYTEHMQDIIFDIQNDKFDLSEVENVEDFKDFIFFSNIYGSLLIDKFKKYSDYE